MSHIFSTHSKKSSIHVRNPFHRRVLVTPSLPTVTLKLTPDGLLRFQTYLRSLETTVGAFTSNAWRLLRWTLTYKHSGVYIAICSDDGTVLDKRKLADFVPPQKQIHTVKTQPLVS